MSFHNTELVVNQSIYIGSSFQRSHQDACVMEQPLVLSHLILSTMPLPSHQINYPTLQFGCVIEQPLSPLSYLFDLINYASLILLNKLSILFHPIIVWPCG